MAKQITEKFKPFLALIIPIALIALASWVLQITLVSNPEKITTWLRSFGTFLVPAYFLFQTIGIVFPPAPGGIFQIALIAIFGPLKGVVLIYLTVTPLYCVNFLLAKKYGRPFVTRMVGKDSMTRLDDYAKDAGLGGLIMLKLLQGSYFDYISYGLGLTSTKFKPFFWVNLLGEIPRDIFIYFIFKNGPNFFISFLLMELFAGSLTVSYIALRHLQHIHRKHELSKVKD